MNSRNWVCIIPARSGSKRLPGKNTRDFDGHTLLEIAVKKALSLDFFREVIVSTDCRVIEDYSKSLGATSYGLRPAPLASDEASSNDVVLHLLNNVLDSSIEGFTLLQCTSPFTSLETIMGVTQKALESKGSCISVRELEGAYKEWLYISKDERLESLFVSSGYDRSQDSTPLLLPTGNAYSSGRKHFCEHKTFLGTNWSFSYLVRSKREWCDIDTIEDFEYAMTLIEK